jgi:Fe-S cluster assembly protein SufB
MATPGAIAEKEAVGGINSDYKEKFGFHDSETGYAYKAPKGLNKEIVESISDYKKEPEWMRDFRLKAYETFVDKPTPQWGADLDQIDFDDIHYFVRAPRRTAATGPRSPRTSRTPTTGSASPRPSASSWPASARSPSPRSSTTR